MNLPNLPLAPEPFTLETAKEILGMKSIYQEGRQPCTTLQREQEGGRDNIHQCPRCLGRRTFCLTCARDHHEHGWDTCKPNAYGDHDDA